MNFKLTWILNIIITYVNVYLNDFMGVHATHVKRRWQVKWVGQGKDQEILKVNCRASYVRLYDITVGQP